MEKSLLPSNKMSEKEGQIEELRGRLSDIPPLEDEKDFFLSEETLARYLKSCNWNVAEAEKYLKDTIEYRRKTRPLYVDCKYCHERPGYHSMRQVGFDEMGRPVIYANFAQASTHKYMLDDSVAHVTYLVENAKRTMKAGITTWVFVIDCTGMTLSACNPKLGYGVTQALADHYPERLGLVLCINHNAVFHGVWHAIKSFLHPQTVSKMKFIRSKRKVLSSFHKYFSDELTDWLIKEIKNNKQKPIPSSQKEFWNGAKNGHDPRGCPSYIKEYIEPYFKNVGSAKPSHKPHPNIIDTSRGRVHSITLTAEELKEREQAQAQAADDATGSDDDDIPDGSGIDIDEVFQIPSDAAKLCT
ncbi:hypothetical protein LOTGIDRAFT_211338 [Lottia gigantea]|uniref:CRAL-TRIO domain-containing protein n=1 Tax=Lottia gigantea TaxID=225164 RepID=V3YXA0_LOTGI|nr:hypothetical protein LOTGIDRAFT_211338 [Lottia gigantea]ESO82698.1 hypothetical protein LOTGIDRAFT_211338 [Lottia gigantea]